MGDEAKNDPMRQITPTFFMESGVIRGLLAAIISLVALVASLFFGIEGLDDKLTQLIEPLVLIITTFGAIGFALYQRLKKPTPPLTATRVAAEEKKPEMARALVQAAQSPEVQKSAADTTTQPNGDMQ